jgi:hypothetical protein
MHAATSITLTNRSNSIGSEAAMVAVPCASTNGSLELTVLLCRTLAYRRETACGDLLG